MENQLKVFNNADFGDVRVIMQEGKPWFVGKDVASALGYLKPENAIANHVDDEDKTSTLIQGRGSNYKSKAVLINESGLYSLIMSSKLPTAKAFKRWVTSEVLPSIHKTGGYIAGSESMSDSELLAKAVLVAQETIKQRDKRINELENDTARMKPKEIFADAVSASGATMLIGELAKILKQNGVQIGQNRLFTWLRDNGYLVKRKCADHNKPTQKAMEMGLFKIKETTVVHSDGHTSVATTTKLTGKGQQYFINKLLAEKDGAVA